MKKVNLISVLALVSAFVLFSCGEDESTTPTSGNDNNEVPEVYKKIYGASDIYLDGEFVVIKTTGVPDHKSPYFKNTQWENEKYEAYNGSNTAFRQNPNTISSFDMTYRIPRNPVKSNSSNPTNLGSIGISLNGVAIYNQYAGPNEPLTNEINSFDQHLGHPQQQGQYHYHIEPTYLTGKEGRNVLLGFLLDGFPVYGPMENGKLISNNDLDAFHGHEHATTDYPNGIYHYHITDADPYINGSGFYGNPGTVSR